MLIFGNLWNHVVQFIVIWRNFFAGHAQALARNQKNEVSFVIHNLPVIAKMAAVAKVNYQFSKNFNLLVTYFHELRIDESWIFFDDFFLVFVYVRSSHILQGVEWRI